VSGALSGLSTGPPFDSSLMQRHWTFEASEVEVPRRRKVLRALLRRAVPRPQSVVVKAAQPNARWALYFIYAPEGQLLPVHRFTLARLRDEGFAILAVCAGTARADVPQGIATYADAICWKAPGGYDFSAYAIGLELLARHSPGANVLVLNDSVLGPFHALRRYVDRVEWNFTGFTASGVIENHVQSYAFVVADVTPAKVRRMWPVLFPYLAFDGRADVIFCQETRLARIVSRQMSTGSLWYYPAGDLTLLAPLELLDEDFPFVKRSLLTDRYPVTDRPRLVERLARLGHPLD
jgi:lipopolysaccharide biosynthesis protein